MKEVKLGNTGLTVPRLGIGLDWKGEINTRLGKKILIKAFNKGCYLWDSADNYGTHPYIRKAIKNIDRKKVVISTKISSKSYKEAKKDLSNCLKELGTDYIDILFLHAIDSVKDFKERKGAWDYLKEAKKEGLILTKGVSSHSAKMVDFLATSDTDVILTTMNSVGRSVNGSVKNMKKAIKKASKNKKGLLGMKVLGNGNDELLKNVKKSIKFASKIPFDSLVIGTMKISDLDSNTKIIEEIY